MSLSFLQHKLKERDWGGFLGIFSKKGLGLSEEELARLKGELANGKAALVVLCDGEEVAATKAELESLGGQPESYQGVVEDLEQAAQEVNAPLPLRVVPQRVVLFYQV